MEGQFATPPLCTNEDGAERRVGVEVEFGGLDGLPAARLVADLLGGRIVEKDPYDFRVKDTSLGEFTVKLDTRFGHHRSTSTDVLGALEARLSTAFGAAASFIVPHEIVAPPVPLRQLATIEALLSRLRSAGAVGTEQSVFFAYGLHLNPEAARLDANYITAILKAFVMLGPWLRKRINPDLTRRLLGFADPFPRDYRAKLARADYWPEFDQLIDDYVEANPTRNRDLDMLPLFAHLDQSRVRTKLPDEKINPRPAFHYRLPDAKLSDARWTLATEWNRWVAVERLAADRSRLDRISAAYRGQGWASSWPERVEALLA
jgi:Putative amidoligase enzyme